jgi:ABC-type multidrug transport system fused ATPase/permease subunit
MIAQLRRRSSRYRAVWRSLVRMLRRFAPQLGRHRRRVALAVIFGLAYPFVRLLEPWPLKLVFDSVLLGHPLPAYAAPLLADPASEPLALLYQLAAAVVLVALTGGLLYYLQRLHGAILSQELATELRQELYSHIQRLSFGFHDRRRTGDLIVRLTSDIRMLRDALVALPLELTGHLLLMAGMVTVMAFMDWRLTAVACVLVPGIGILVRRYRRPMKQAIRQQRDREGHLATIASEALAAVRVVQGFRGERHEIRRFGGESRRSLRSGVRAARLEAKFRWSTDVTVAVVTAVTVTWAARRILDGTLSPGDLLVFMAYLRAFARPVQRSSRITERILRAATAGERVLEILRTRSDVRERTGAVRAPRVSGEVSVEEVWFAYRGSHWVLEEVSLRVAAGERVALVGPTGSGKSTLLNLIPRFYDPTRGCVRLDGHDLRELTLASLRRQITLLFQEPVLFASSIAENIAYARPEATLEEVRRAARRAGIDRVVAALPQGYDTILGERGGTLSGGQRQCVAIARAMMRNAPIVLLDEPTTGLDAEAASRVMTALERLVEGRTVIAISHHPAELRGIDRVIALAGGRVVGGESQAPPVDLADARENLR